MPPSPTLSSSSTLSSYTESRSLSRTPSIKSTECPTLKMPTQAPRVKLRRWVVSVVLSIILLLLGVSSFFWGVVMINRGGGNILQEFGGLLLCIIGFLMGFSGVWSSLFSFISLAEEYSARMARPGSIEW